MPGIQRRRQLLILTRFAGLVLVAGLTVGIFFAFQFRRGDQVAGRDIQGLFDEAETWRVHGEGAVQTLGVLKVKYEKVIQAAPESSWAQKALLRLAEMERGGGDLRRARDYLYRLINGYPESNLTAQARYMMGRIWQKDVGDADRALASYRIVVNSYLAALNGGGEKEAATTHRLTGNRILQGVVLNAIVAIAEIEADRGQYETAVEMIGLARERFANAPITESLMMWEADLRADRLGDTLGARNLWSDMLLNRGWSAWGEVAERRMEGEH